jgi:diguanylate cyclase (GGDEF)-like protein/PAS domain S-box-containing protein
MWLSQLTFGLGLSGKLLRLVAVNALALLLLGGVTYLALDHIKVLSRQVTEQHIGEMRANASLADRLTRVFGDIEKLSRTFLKRDQWLLAESRRISDDLLDLGQLNDDIQLGQDLYRLDQRFAEFVDASLHVNQALRQTISLGNTAATAIDTLEQRISEWLIEAALAGRPVDYIDQVMVLTTGFRESLLAIGKQHAEHNLRVFTVGDRDPQPQSGLFDTFDDLLLRLQTLRASEPEIASLGTAIERSVRDYREQILQFGEALSQQHQQLSDLREVRDSAAQRLDDMQLRNAQQADGLTQTIARLINEVGGFLLFVVLLILGVVTLLTASMIRRNIRQPLSQLVNGIAAMDRPAAQDIQLDRSDEWQVLADALNRMHRALADSYRQLQDSESKYRLLIEHQSDMVIEMGPDYRLRFVSPSFAAMLGKPAEEIIGEGFFAPVHEDDRARARAELAALSAQPHTIFIQLRMMTSRDWRHLAWSCRWVEDPDKQRATIVAIGRDVTERRRAEIALEQQRQFLRTVIDAVSDPVLVIGRDYRIRMSNQAAIDEFLIDGADSACFEATYGREQPCMDRGYSCPLRDVVDQGRPGTAIRMHRSKRGDRTYEVAASPLLDGDGQVDGVVQIYRDITDKLEAEQRIRFLAHHDALTELPNRVLLRDRFQQASGFADREGYRVAVMFLDLDHFKDINDTLGHDVGDRLLQAVVDRVTGTLRDTDTVSRQGGDEFVILVPQIGYDAEPETVAGHISESMRKPILIDGHELRPSFSIGIALYPDDGRDFDTLLRNADTAMYSAKDAGRNTYRFYADRMNASAFERLQLHGRLRNVVERDELEMYYQPQLDIETGEIIGAEALLRWHTDEFGTLLPDQFIAVAEASGAIAEIGGWTLRTVCRQLAQWRTALALPVPVSVNLSALQLDTERLVEDVAGLMAEYDIPPELLELELTESTLFRDTESVVDRVLALKGLGIRLSIDDFGTGYSSLVYLKRFQPDRLKIDRSFVQDLNSDAEDAAIVRAIIHMAHSLNMAVIAEGVETSDQLEWLRRERCEQVQGFLFYKPLPEGRMTELLRGQVNGNNGLVGVSTASATD